MPVCSHLPFFLTQEDESACIGCLLDAKEDSRTRLVQSLTYKQRCLFETYERAEEAWTAQMRQQMVASFKAALDHQSQGFLIAQQERDSLYFKKVALNLPVPQRAAS